MNDSKRSNKLRSAGISIALFAATGVSLLALSLATETPLSINVFEPVPEVQATSISPVPRVVVSSTSQADITAAINQIKDANGGTLHFPAGKYFMSFLGNNRTDLYFEDLQEFKMTGDGPESEVIFEQAESAKATQTRLISIDGAERLEISDLKLVGQRDFMIPDNTPEFGENTFWLAKQESDPLTFKEYSNAEHQSLIFLRSISKSTYIHDIIFRDAGGDAVNMANVDSVVLEDNDLNRLGRNGFTLGGVTGKERSTNVRIERNIFGSDIDTQQIDVELHNGPGSPGVYKHDFSVLNQNFRVKNNHFKRQIPQDTIDQDQYAMTIIGVDNVQFTGNMVENPLLVFRASNVSIRDNTEIPFLSAYRSVTSLEAINNTFALEPMQRRNSRPGGIVFEERAAEPLDFAVLRCNIITSQGLEHPIVIHNVLKAFIENNQFVEVTGEKSHLKIEADRSDIDINIAGNSFNESQIDRFIKKGLNVNETNDKKDCAGGFPTGSTEALVLPAPVFGGDLLNDQGYIEFGAASDSEL